MNRRLTLRAFGAAAIAPRALAVLAVVSVLGGAAVACGSSDDASGTSPTVDAGSDGGSLVDSPDATIDGSFAGDDDGDSSTAIDLDATLPSSDAGDASDAASAVDGATGGGARWTLDTSFGTSGYLEFPGPNELLSADIWLTATQDAVWLVGSAGDTDAYLVGVQRDGGVLSKARITESVAPSGAVASGGSVYFFSYLAPGDGDNSTSNTIVSLYKRDVDGGVTRRNHSSVADPDFNPLAVVALDDAGLLRVVGGNGTNAQGVDLLADGGAKLTTYKDAGAEEAVTGVKVDGGTWLVAGCEEDCDDAGNGAFFVGDDGALQPIGHHGYPALINTIAASGGNVLVGGAGTNAMTMAYAALPDGGASTFTFPIGGDGPYLSANPNSSGGFVTSLSSGTTSSTNVTLVSLASDGTFAGGSFDASSGTVALEANVSLQAMIADDRYIYVAVSIARNNQTDASGAIVWRLFRFTTPA